MEPRRETELVVLLRGIAGSLERIVAALERLAQPQPGQLGPPAVHHYHHSEDVWRPRTGAGS